MKNKKLKFGLWRECSKGQWGQDLNKARVISARIPEQDRVEIG